MMRVLNWRPRTIPIHCKKALYALANMLANTGAATFVWRMAREVEEEAAARSVTSAEDVAWKLLIAVEPDFEWDTKNTALLLDQARDVLGVAA